MRFTIIPLIIIVALLFGVGAILLPVSVDAQQQCPPGTILDGGKCIPCDQYAKFGCFEAPIPGNIHVTIAGFLAANQGQAPLLKYISLVINFVTALIVVIGIITIVAGGFIYMTARGSAEQVGKAKVLIGSALLGITLALTAWIILNTVSPQFASDVREPCLPGSKDACGVGVACPASGQCPR